MTESSERSSADSTRRQRSAVGELGRLVRPMAILALFTVVLAQGIAPALKTAGVLAGRFIDPIDLAAAISSHMLALTASALSIGLLLSVGRNPRVALTSRVLLVAQAALVLVLAVPASRFRLSPFACFLLGIVACSAAMAGAFEGLREPRSRALGIVLGLVALAGSARVVSAGLIAIPSATQATKLVPLSNALSTGAVILFGIALLVALAWLASRRRKAISLATTSALTVAVLLTWAARSGIRVDASGWMVLAARTQEQLTALPGSIFPPVVDGFVAVLGPIVAATALLTRGQMGLVVGSLALALTAGTVVDVPGHALIMVVASLATALAAHDDQGMWEALMGKRLESSTPTDPPAASDASAEDA